MKMYSIQKNQSLKAFNTMSIDVMAHDYVQVHSIDEVLSFLKSDYTQPLYILGGGSNVVFLDDFSGTILHVHILGKEVIERKEDEVYVKVNAGENWQTFVQWTLSQDFGGLENLSWIPGRVGASPMQNIGAYGVEIKDVFHELEAIEIETGKLVKFNKTECNFGYRESIFKKELKGKYIILNITYRLTQRNHQIKIAYGAIQQQLETMGVTNPKIQDIANAVIAIRKEKLPNPLQTPNCGSFFKNPTIPESTYNDLKFKFPEIPGYPLDNDEVKVPAGWLIEKAGWKGYKNQTVGVHDRQALVLINYHHGTGQDILNLSQEIIADIQDKFGIKLEREVNVI